MSWSEELKSIDIALNMPVGVWFRCTELVAILESKGVENVKKEHVSSRLSSFFIGGHIDKQKNERGGYKRGFFMLRECERESFIKYCKEMKRTKSMRNNSMPSNKAKTKKETTMQKIDKLCFSTPF